MSLLESKTPEIYAALIQVMQSVGSIAKDQENEAQKFKFRGIEQVMNALQPALIKHSVLVVPTVTDKDIELRVSAKGTQMTFIRLTMEFRFIAASDGSSVVATVLGEAMDFGDKAANKAMSIAYKYACFQVLSIPTEDNATDPDSVTHEPTTASIPLSRPSSNGLPFKSPAEAISWGAGLLNITDAEATAMLESAPADAQGRKAHGYHALVLAKSNGEQQHGRGHC